MIDQISCRIVPCHHVRKLPVSGLGPTHSQLITLLPHHLREMPSVALETRFIESVVFDFTYHIFVASSAAVSNLPENMAMFSPYPLRSFCVACCSLRARANFSAQACASFAISSDHVSGDTLCLVRYLL